MTLNTLVLGFEVAIVILLCVLCFQLARQYRLFSEKGLSTGPDTSSTNVKSVKVERVASQNESLALVKALKGSAKVGDVDAKSGRNPLSVVAKGTPANSEWVQEDSPQNQPSNLILNDYIDGFFNEGSSVSAEQLASFKTEAPKSEVETGTIEIVQGEDLGDVAVPVLQPILLDETKMDDEDDSFILVEEESLDVDGSSSETPDVMSDKVVLAMLKEAKTACSQ